MYSFHKFVCSEKAFKDFVCLIGADLFVVSLEDAAFVKK